MTIKKLSPEQLLALDRFTVNESTPHILVDKTICAKCSPRPCLVVCPARCYRLKDDEVNFEYAGCLECGTCRVMCTDKGVTSWNYPAATYGVSFRTS
jgi:ferredoxin like protein